MAHNANSFFTLVTKGIHIGYGVLVTSKVLNHQYDLVVKGQDQSLLKICNTAFNLTSSSSFYILTEGVHIWYIDFLWFVDYSPV